MSVFCPNCKHELPEMKKFCPFCGYHFEVASQQVQPQMKPVQPQVQQVQPQPQMQQPVKKKKSKKGLIIALAIVFILIAGIVVGAAVLYPMIQKSGLIDTIESKVEDVENKEDNDTSEDSAEAEENEVVVALQEKMDTGDYEGAISDILAMEEGEDSYEEASALLESAIDGQLTASMENMDFLASEGSYAEAVDACDTELEYRNSLLEDDRAASFVSDTTVLDEKKENLLSSYREYVSTEAMSCANNRDEAGITDIFATSDAYLEGDEYEAVKTATYAKLVVNEANGMNSEGKAPGEVLDYINSNLSMVGNDCWVLEMWDFFNALEEYQTGNVTASTKVTHVTDGYILMNSDSAYLTDADLSNLSKTELRMARYEIYARHGRVFSDQEVADYFGQYDWYHADVEPGDFEETELNEYEKANVDLLVSYEQFMGYR